MKLSNRTHVVRTKLIPAFLGVLAPVLLLLVFKVEVLADDFVAPVADFSYTQSGQIVTYTDTSTDADNIITEWYWDLGDGNHVSMEETVEHYYERGGTYTVSLEVVDATGLRNTITEDVVVGGPAPTPPETYFYFGIDGYEVTFWDSSSDADGEIVWKYWDLGDGTHVVNQDSIVHTYEFPNTYPVTLVVTDNDGQETAITRDVVIYDESPVQPTADFTYNANANEITFYDASVDNGREITEWYWDLGDGTHEAMTQQVAHTYTYGGTFTVKLEVVNILGQRNTVEKEVVVEGPQRANPEASYNYDTSDNVTFSFTDTSTSSNGDIVERYWDMGNGTHIATESQVVYSYPRAGTYTVKLEVVDVLGYRDIYEQAITAEQAPLATPEASFTEYIADGSYSADFYDTSTSANGGITEWYWDFGDGTHTGGEPNVSHTYAYSGTYTVKLEVVDEFGARATTEREYTILGASRGPAEAYFTFHNDIETGTVTFYDNSSSPNGAITERYWDLGDGTFVTGETLFEHTYEPGIYFVTLEVVDTIGERNTYEVSFQII